LEKVPGCELIQASTVHEHPCKPTLWMYSCSNSGGWVFSDWFRLRDITHSMQEYQTNLLCAKLWVGLSGRLRALLNKTTCFHFYFSLWSLVDIMAKKPPKNEVILKNGILTLEWPLKLQTKIICWVTCSPITHWNVRITFFAKNALECILQFFKSILQTILKH